MVANESAQAIEGEGIAGDRYAMGKGKYSRSPGGREVTLFENETILALKQEHGIELRPQEHRRNLTTEGIRLDDLIGKTFKIGDVILEGLRSCRPCRYLNVMSKKQVFTHLTDRSGIYARIVSGGTLRCGDEIDII